MATALTDEQKRRIEENRLKALQKRANSLTSPHKSATLVGQNPSANSWSPINNKQAVSHSFPSSHLQRNRYNVQGLQSPGKGSYEHTKPYRNRANSSPYSKKSKYKSGSSSSQLSGDKVADMVSSISSPTASLVLGTCVLISRERFQVECAYNPMLVTIFKDIPTRNYDTATKRWDFNLEDYGKLYKAVVKAGAKLTPLPSAIIRVFHTQLNGRYNVTRNIPEANLSQVDPVIVNALLPFQKTGVNFGVWKNGRVLIADDMGLGKTIQAICIACYYKTEWPLLIIVPSSVRFCWKESLLRWVPSLQESQIRVVVTGKEDCCAGLINILSYDIMTRRANELKAAQFGVVIMDESHLLKNAKTARCKAALSILQKAKRVLLLTGTPALSRPCELHSQIHAIDKTLFPKFKDFGVRYCDGKMTQWGWDYTGSSNLTELQLLLEEAIMIRRLKSAVIEELPDKRRETVTLDPSLVEKGKSMNVSASLLRSTKLKGMEKRGCLLQYFHETSKAKLKAVKRFVLEHLENGTKFLVFAHHAQMLNCLEEAVIEKKYGYIRIDGSVNSEKRKSLCDEFQGSDSVRVALLSITAANAGINLTAASRVVFAELFWNPGILVQAEDRAHRIGQKDCVTVQYLVAEGTADDFIWPLVQTKLEVLGRAGLTADDFSNADATKMQTSAPDIVSMFKECFFEENNELNNDSKTIPESAKGKIDSYFESDKVFKARTAPTACESISHPSASKACESISHPSAPTVCESFSPLKCAISDDSGVESMLDSSAKSCRSGNSGTKPDSIEEVEQAMGGIDWFDSIDDDWDLE